MYRFYSLSFLMLGLLLSFNAYSQKKELKAAAAASLVYGADKILLDEDRGSPAFVHLSKDLKITEPEHLQWLKQEVLKISSNHELKIERIEKDQLGYTHYRYSQKYNGLKVEHGVYYVHIKNGYVVSANGEYYNNIPDKLPLKINYEDCRNEALREFKYQNGTEVSDKHQTPLVILKAAGTYHKCYRFELYNGAVLKKSFVYVDVTSGKAVFQEQRIHHTDVTGTAQTAYSSTQNITFDQISSGNYRLRESGRGGGIATRNCNNSSDYTYATDFTNTSTTWTATTNVDKSVFDLHYGLEKTYDYYYNTFGRNSFDNAGAPINGYAHYSYQYSNAFWDGTAVVFGDGDGYTYLPFTTTDIVGHEITHAVTENTAGLIYSDESGGLNESFSDIFGVTVDFYANPSTANFLEGEQASASGTPFRDMTNPNNTQQPDTYMGTYWIPAGGSDNGGVHTNSQVQNYWYYLLCNGGSGVNDNGDSYTVNGIGIADAAAITYRNLTHYLTPGSQFSDARYYAIQSAVDLFGECSSQVIECTNAWHAVGVGGIFSNTVLAQFGSSSNYSCVVPATIAFTNQSVNATSFEWNFGDGGTSVSANPTHTYSAIGTYDVQLIANGSATCGTTDTLLKHSYINVTNAGTPTPACTPAQGSTSDYYGISKVQFGAIDHSSNGSSEGYADNTCTQQATLIAGSTYLLKVTTLGTENVRVWIDYNNDGAFNNSNELVMTSDNITGLTSALINTPTTAVLNTPLRMRVYDDYYYYTIGTACQAHTYGQTEDYTVIFEANTQPPQANFTVSDNTVPVASTVQFYDSSQYAPTSWHWSFSGGSPTSSNVQNPAVTYGAPGIYPVSLVCSNSFGADSITKTSYITVVNSYSMCASSSYTSTAVSGVLYDSGGPSGAYSNGENCNFTIDPGCATSITLTFSEFSTEGGLDYLSVYDGPAGSGTLLGQYSGSYIPSSLVASSGKVYLTWYTDGSVTYPGFQINWTSTVTGTVTPVASFTVSGNNPPLATPVNFTDQTTGSPNQWEWDFGDGSYSYVQNPGHSYSTPGVKNIRLISHNCIAADTAYMSVTVQPAPTLIITPDTLSAVLGCGSTTSIPINMQNTGSGDLVFSSSTAGSDTVKVLMCSYGSDMTSGGEYYNTLSGLQQYFNRVHITQYSGNTVSGLQTAMAGVDVIIFAEQESGSYSHYASYATILNDFVSAGGRVIFCGSSYTNYRIFDTGLFSGSYYGYLYSSTVNVTTLNDSITHNLTSTSINAPNSTDYYMINNTDKVTLVNYSSYYDVVCYREIGSGMAITIGCDFYQIDPNFSKMLAAAVRSSKGSSGLGLQIPVDTIGAGQSMSNSVVIDASYYTAGTYTTTVNVSNNDPAHDPYPIVVTYTVTGQPYANLSDNCLNFPSIIQYTTSTDTLMITNTGCDDLIVSSITTGTSVFSCPSASFTLAPGAATTVIVTYAPTTVGNHTDNLVITANDGVHTVCLTGTATTPPQVQLSTHSLSANLAACSGPQTLTFDINDIGGAALHFNLTGESSNRPVEILAMVNGADTYQRYPQTINAINQYFVNYTLTQFQSGSASDLQAALANTDVLLIPSLYYYSYGYLATMASVIQNYVNSGGRLVICGSTANVLNDLGIFENDLVSSAYSGGMVNILDTTSFLTKNMPANMNILSTTVYADITETGVQVLGQYYGYDVLATKSYGSGEAVYIGFDFYQIDNNLSRLISNAVRSVSLNEFPAWLSASPLSGTTNAGSNTAISLTFDPGSMTAGTYTTYVIISSDDPLTPKDSVLCTLTVGSNPCVNFTYNVADDCSGNVAFNDTLINGISSVHWDFGDGTSSTQHHPTHTYSAAGTYTAVLQGCSGSVCDTTSHIVTVSSVGGPVAASCIPMYPYTGYGLGVYNVTLNTINNSTGDGSDGYQDYSCTQQTSLEVGNVYSISVTTGPSYPEYVTVWIDYNNNGVFTDDEKVMNNISGIPNHTGTFTVPSGAVLNTALRMRVFSDYDYVNYPCTDYIYGQCEDYAVFVFPVASPPVTAFIISSVSSCQGIANFHDNTLNNPTSWTWNFGDGSVSHVQHPSHAYTTAGTYTITLVCSNNYGSSYATQTVTVSPLLFSVDVSGDLIVGNDLAFSTTFSGAVSYSWNFGDGSGAGTQYATHAYDTLGAYDVSLTVVSGSCVNTLYKTLVITDQAGNGSSFPNGTMVNVYPNPSVGSANLIIRMNYEWPISVYISDAAGQIISKPFNEKILPKGDNYYLLDELAAGVYFINVKIGADVRTIKFVVLTH